MKTLPLLTTMLAVSTVSCGGSAQRAQPMPELSEPSTPPVPLAVTTPLFIPGEHIVWDVTWKGMTGGRAQMVTGEPGSLPDGRQAIIVRSESRSDGLIAVVKHIRDELTTTIDTATAHPIESQGRFEFGKKRSAVQAWYLGSEYRIVYARQGKPVKQWTQPMPPGEAAYNTHAAIGALRGWQPTEGDRAYFYILSGRRLYRIDVGLAGREVISTELGDQPTIRIEGVGRRLTRSFQHSKRKPRRFTVWFSDDASRIPLRVQAVTEYGEVRVELLTYER